MNEYVRKRIEEMAVDFTSVQSVVDTEGEITMAEKVYDTMSEIDYYKKNPEKLYYIDLKDDLIGRKIVVAELNGEKKASDKTIVLFGHFDTAHGMGRRISRLLTPRRQLQYIERQEPLWLNLLKNPAMAL